MNRKECAELYKELEVLENYGIHMIMGGLEASAFQVVQAHTMRESGVYMRDYILNDSGHVEAVSFDQIK